LSRSIQRPARPILIILATAFHVPMPSGRPSSSDRGVRIARFAQGYFSVVAAGFFSTFAGISTTSPGLSPIFAHVPALSSMTYCAGEVGPRPQTVFKKQAFAGQEERLRAVVAAQPDQTLAELREALQSSASLSSVWRALDRLRLTVKKNGTRRGATSPRRRG